MKETRPVVIVGAGPTGMTAAIELVRFGLPVRLVDKYSAPPDTSRALAVQSRTVELMHQRGLADELLRLGNKALFTTLYADGKQLGKVDLRQIDSRFNFILLLAQSETERILREWLKRAGVAVERQTELVALSQSEGSASGVQTTLRRPDTTLEELEAAYLIDASGAHTIVRHSMDLAFEGRSLPNTYALADLYSDGDLPEDQLSIFIARSGLLAAFPMGHRRFRIIATEKQPTAKEPPAPDLAYIEAAWSRGAHVAGRFRDLQWSSRFRINSRALNKLRHGRVFFGGDAAHIHSPAGGQGMNTGMQDMINLAWKLAMVYRGFAGDELLDTYNEERLPIIHELVSTTERATDLLNSDSQLVHTLMQHALPLALSFKGIGRKGASVVSELGGNYRNSSLCGVADGHGALRPGDRFPDLPVEEGRDRKALDMLDPSALTILCLEGAELPGLDQHATDLCVTRLISQPSSLLKTALGEATVAVVRPDGYLLCAGSPGTVATQLSDWFLRWLPGMSASVF